MVRFHQQSTMDMLRSNQQRSPIDFSEDESDLVYHLPCSREQDGGPAGDLDVGDGSWFTRDDLQPRTKQLPERYRQVFEQQQAFNRDLAGVNPEPVREEALQAALDHRPALAQLFGYFQEADALAIRFQHRRSVQSGRPFCLSALLG